MNHQSPFQLLLLCGQEEPKLNVYIHPCLLMHSSTRGGVAFTKTSSSTLFQMPLIGFPLCTNITHTFPFVLYSSLPMVPIPSIKYMNSIRNSSQVLMCFLYSHLDIVYFKFFSAFIGEVGMVPRMVTTLRGDDFGFTIQCTSQVDTTLSLGEFMISNQFWFYSCTHQQLAKKVFLWVISQLMGLGGSTLEGGHSLFLWCRLQGALNLILLVPSILSYHM